jgi:hypothetical protein
MKKIFGVNILTVMVFFFSAEFFPQTIDGEWYCAYATIDDQPNATGNRTISVAVYGENDFVALVNRPPTFNFYLVAYKDADSVNGRLGYYPYAGSNNIMNWLYFFDQVPLNDPNDMAYYNMDGKHLVFVANNDEARNILVFEATGDSIESYPMRLSTGTEYIWAIDIDKQGRVYLTRPGTETTPGTIVIYDGPADDPAWSTVYQTTPKHEITLPEPGEARGITVNDDGTVIYVSNVHTRKVYCYLGDPSSGYTLYTGFNFSVDDIVTDGTDTLYPGPFGLQLMPEKNILFVAHSTNFTNTLLGYSFSRVYLVNPNTGEKLDTIDVAEWNRAQTGVYNNNAPGNVSGYGSTYNADFDENFNVYVNSYYGWTIDKWVYTGTLPTIPLTIVGLERDEIIEPFSFTLSQNYPNPFNPVTIIEFSLDEDSEIDLSVYSMTGQLITTLIKSSQFSKGNYKVTFDASKLASGNYIYKLKSNGRQLVRKMSLLK